MVPRISSFVHILEGFVMTKCRFPRSRSFMNFDRAAWSELHGLPDTGPSLTVQSQKEEADINTIVRNFGVTGKVPVGVRTPTYGDFDGVDDYADFFAPSLGTTTTVEMWAKIGAGYTNKMFFGWNLYDFTGVAGAIGFNTGAGDVYGISSATVTSLGLVNNWKHYVMEMRSDVSYTNNKVYVNSTQLTLSQQAGTENAANRSFNSGNGRISGWRFNTSYPMPMSCSTFRVYNRALTTDEIQQNFNAARGRYNL